MPGLLRGMARTAAVAGTATAVSNRVSRRQAEKWSAQDSQYVPARVNPTQPPPDQYQQQAYAPPPPPAPPPAAASDARIEHLKELGRLKEQGVLTDAEFAAEKARILTS
jgi:type IV secretory pathway VirB10-like protein